MNIKPEKAIPCKQVPPGAASATGGTVPQAFWCSQNMDVFPLLLNAFLKLNYLKDNYLFKIISPANIDIEGATSLNVPSQESLGTFSIQTVTAFTWQGRV